MLAAPYTAWPAISRYPLASDAQEHSLRFHSLLAPKRCCARGYSFPEQVAAAQPLGSTWQSPAPWRRRQHWCSMLSRSIESTAVRLLTKPITMRSCQVRCMQRTARSAMHAPWQHTPANSQTNPQGLTGARAPVKSSGKCIRSLQAVSHPIWTHLVFKSFTRQMHGPMMTLLPGKFLTPCMKSSVCSTDGP